MVLAASIDRTAAAMSHRASRMRVRRTDVKDFDTSFTWLIVASNSSGAGAGAAASTITRNKQVSMMPLVNKKYFVPNSDCCLILERRFQLETTNIPVIV